MRWWIQWHADRIAYTVIRITDWTKEHWPITIETKNRSHQRYYDGFNDGWVTAMEILADEDTTLFYNLYGDGPINEANDTWTDIEDNPHNTVNNDALHGALVEQNRR
jgi:hypothetical protein